MICHALFVQCCIDLFLRLSKDQILFFYYVLICKLLELKDGVLPFYPDCKSWLLVALFASSQKQCLFSYNSVRFNAFVRLFHMFSGSSG